MKKTELKQILKPLIKECIKEVILEEGVLSSVVSEVVRGMGSATIVEQKTEPTKQERLFNITNDTTSSRISESRKQLMDSIGEGAYNGVNLFEDVQPMADAGTTSGRSPAPHSPLSDTDPRDPGVNINGIMNLAAGKWNKFL